MCLAPYYFGFPLGTLLFSTTVVTLLRNGNPNKNPHKSLRRILPNKLAFVFTRNRHPMDKSECRIGTIVTCNALRTINTQNSCSIILYLSGKRKRGRQVKMGTDDIKGYYIQLATAIKACQDPL